jgi:hypothetical protein
VVLAIIKERKGKRGVACSGPIYVPQSRMVQTTTETRMDIY